MKFMAVLRMVKNYLWIFCLGLVLLIGIGLTIYFVVKKKKDAQPIKKEGSLAKVVEEQIVEATTQVKIDNAIIKERSAEKQRELDEIRNEPDAKKRRERLASALQRNL